MGRRPKYANLEEAYRGKNARRRERRANASTMDNSGWHQGIKRIPRNSNACQATSCEEELKLTPSAGTTPNQLMNAENSEFPEYFKWNQQSKIWKERKQRKVIGRILGAHLSEGERYYLRMLLMHVRKPTSFLDLRTMNGHACTSFREAADMMGLLQTDNAASYVYQKQFYIKCQIHCVNYLMLS
ncbi:uncharacterized protein [Coffea arabica]|uniref:Uncharacterized protein isoform X4 n=1 Tax=Coffea arabica TaxID=13443 RepID=A0ABM4WL46_COFAR